MSVGNAEEVTQHIHTHIFLLSPIENQLHTFKTHKRTCTDPAPHAAHQGQTWSMFTWARSHSWTTVKLMTLCTTLLPQNKHTHTLTYSSVCSVNNSTVILTHSKCKWIIQTAAYRYINITSFQCFNWLAFLTCWLCLSSQNKSSCKQKFFHYYYFFKNIIFSDQSTSKSTFVTCARSINLLSARKHLSRLWSFL